jgi:hypothetical protein
MMNKKSISQNEVAGFLLGLGIGLVVGILFNPQPAGYPHGSFRDTAKAGRSVSHSGSQSSAVLGDN